MEGFGYGLDAGLAQDLGYNQRINDLRYDEEQMKRIKAENAAKAQLFADDLDFQNAINPYDNPVIKSKMQNQIRSIGTFVRENPDWNTNVNKMMQLKQMKRELKDNPDLIRGLAVDQEYKKLLADYNEVAKNPERHDVTAYDEQMARFKNYFNTGNQSGDKTKGVDAPVYVKPRDFVDINDRWSDIGTKFNDMVPQDIKGAGRGAYQEVPNQSSLQRLAQQEYLQNKRQYDIEAGRKGLDPMQYVMEGINAHIPKKRYLGDYHLSDALTLEGVRRQHEKEDKKPIDLGPTAYDVDFKEKRAGKLNGQHFKEMFGPRPTVPFVTRTGKQGQLVGKDIDYTGNQRDMEVIDPKTNRKVNQKFVEVYTEMPRGVAIEEGFTKDPWGFGDNEPTEDYRDMITVFKKADKDGKAHDMVRLTTWMPVDVNNASHRGVYNRLTTANKFQQDPTNSQPDYTGWTQDDAGNVFDAQGNARGTVNSFK